MAPLNETVVKPTPKSADVCSICLDAIESDHIRTQCNHDFHKKCLSELRKAECPNCRHELTDLPKAIARKIESRKTQNIAERNRENIALSETLIQSRPDLVVDAIDNVLSHIEFRTVSRVDLRNMIAHEPDTMARIVQFILNA